MRISNKTVSIILPTYNESESIVGIIRECKKLRSFFPIEIIVVDGASTDKTVQLAQKEKVKIIKFDKKRGKGADFWAGVIAAKGDYIVQIDADNQFLPSEIPSFISSLEKGADVAIAVRSDHKKGPFIRFVGNRIFIVAATIVLLRPIYDLVAGFKAFKKKAILFLDLKEPHFGYEAEIVAKAVNKGYKITQIPVTYLPRTTGKSQVSPLRDGFLTLLSLLKARLGLLG